MSDIFEKKGRKASPTQQELEFLFSLMEKGYEPREIEFEYQDTDFPPRDQRFIRSQQRYFNAARKVLGESIKAEQDPLVLEARKKHFEDLCDLMEALEEQVGTWGTWSRAIDFSGEEPRDVRIEHEFPKLDGRTFSDYANFYVSDNGKVKTVLWLEIIDQRFPYLQEHMKNEKVWRLYEEWKELAREDLQRRSDLKCSPGGAPSGGGLVFSAVTLPKELYIARQKRVLPGKCDCCP